MNKDLRDLLENMLDGTHLFLDSQLYWRLDEDRYSPDFDVVQSAVANEYIEEDGGDFRYRITHKGELALREE